MPNAPINLPSNGPWLYCARFIITSQNFGNASKNDANFQIKIIKLNGKQTHLTLAIAWKCRMAAYYPWPNPQFFVEYGLEGVDH
jgi:hypothetical protein